MLQERLSEASPSYRDNRHTFDPVAFTMSLGEDPFEIAENLLTGGSEGGKEPKKYRLTTFRPKHEL